MRSNPQDNLFVQIQNGSVISFERLYFNMQPRLFAFSRKFIEDTETARDIVQEIFFELWENKQNTTINTSLEAYLFRTLHNKCLNYIRSQKVHERYASFVDVKIKESELLFFDPDMENYKSIFFKEIERIYKTTVENLPESCRKIFILSRAMGLSNKDIAEKLNLSLRTVENQIYNALKILKIKLKDYLYLLPFLF